MKESIRGSRDPICMLTPLIADMDKILLLSIQSEANRHGINLPWSDIGANLGKCWNQTISGGAVIQHLAKHRKKCIDASMTVPPPLRRGGGSGLLNPSGPRVFQSSIACPSVVTGRVTKKPGPVAKKRRKPSKEASDESDTDHFDSDTDTEPSRRPLKRTRSAGKKRLPYKVKTEDNDSNDEDTDDGAADSEDNGDRTVVAGASFLALEDDVPIKKEKTKKTTTRPSVVLGMTEDGHAFIRKSTVEIEEVEEEEVEEEVEEDIEDSTDEDDDESEEDIAQEVAVGYENTNTASSNPTHLPYDTSTGFDAPLTTEATTDYFPPISYGLSDIGNDHYALGGLPSVESNSGINGMTSSYGNLHNNGSSTNNYYPGLNSFNITAEYGNTIRPCPYQGVYNFGSHEGRGTYYQANNPVGSTLPHLSSPYQPNDISQDNQTTGTISRSTTQQTSSSDNADYAMESWPARRYSIPGMERQAFDDVEFDNAFQDALPY